MSTPHIIIKDISPRIQYVADGMQTDFIYPFPIFHEEDLSVYLNEELQTSKYQIYGASSSDGGWITFDTAPEKNTRITLIRRLPLARVTDFQYGGPFRARDVNDELDYITACLQQLFEEKNRSLTLSITSPMANLVLPPPQKGCALVWNTTEDGLINSDINIGSWVIEALHTSEEIKEIYHQILDLLTVNPGIGYLGLINNLLSLVKCQHPECFDDFGFIHDGMTGSEEDGLITDAFVSSPNYGCICIESCEC